MIRTWKHLSDDPEAMAALDLFCIHGGRRTGDSAEPNHRSARDWW